MANHIIGEINNASITDIALSQLGLTSIPHFIGTNVITNVTQSIDHINEWELDDGNANDHVVKFHIIADRSKEIITTTPNPVDWYQIASSGNKCIIAIATQIQPSITQKKFITAAINTAFLGFKDLVYTTGTIAFEVSLNQLINSKITTSIKQIIRKMNMFASIPNIIS